MDCAMIASPWRLMSLALLCAGGFATGSCAHVEQAKPARSQAEAPAPDNTAQGPHNARWEQLVAGFIEDYMALHPTAAVSFGRHEFDGQLPDWSQTGIARQVELLEKARTTALRFAAAELSVEERFQRGYFVSRMDDELFWLRDVREPFTNPAYYFDAGLDPNTYISMPYAPAEVRLRAFIAYARKVPNALEQIRANLTLPLPRTFIDFATAGFSGFATFYRGDAKQAFAEVSSPALQAELNEVIEPAAEGMLKLTRWLEAERPHATDNFALGAERFAQMLARTEAVATPLPELLALGQQDLERNLKALDMACARYAPRASLQVCVDKLSADKPEGGAVVGARKQLAQLRKYIVDHDLVSIPGTSEALVAEAPPYKRQNSAYIDIPGPYEMNIPAVYYIAPPDPTWTAAEQAAYVPGKADLMFTSVHEVWPGHFLQFLHSNRSPWRFGQLFVGYAFAEGWAHYAEELMVEQGLAKDEPGLWVGQLTNALLRNVRFVCAIGMHTQGMTVQQCEDLFRTQAFQDAGNARQQAARGTYDPGYLNYTLGKLLLRDLRKRWLEQ
ncbi:MAG: hypothetical protein RL701_813, partial [Pseudomonadota bacterium]